MRKKHIKIHLVILWLSTFLSISVVARELPGNWPGGLQLGSAYDSKRHQEINGAACVEGTHVSVGHAEGTISYASEAKFDKIVKAFDGSVSIDGKAPFVKASGSFEYARENASNDERMNWFIEFNAKRKTKTISVNDFRISEYGRNALQAGYADVLRYCGDEYVSEIDLGASLVGTLSIEFASKEDKREFKLAAALDVNFMKGSVQASAAMRKMQQKMGSRTIVKVHAHQKGGNPGQLTGILGNGEIVHCSLSDMKNCLKAFENILKYANGDFKEQLRNEDGYNVIRYRTAPYENSAARRLVPPEGFPILERTIKIKRDKIQNAYEKELAIYTRANYINTKLEYFTPPSQLEAVNDILSKSWDNMLELTSAMDECLKHPNQRCLEYSYELQAYDKNNLEVKVVEQLDPNSNLGKLHKAISEINVDTAHELIRFGGNHLIAECDHQGLNACHQSVKKGHDRLLSMFITDDPYKGVADKSIVHAPCDNAQKYTPLHLAAEGGTSEHVRCMDLLCVAGAEVDCKTASGLTPLQVAVSCGNLKTMRKLISLGADANIKDKENQSLLHLAAANGNVEMIQDLIQKSGLNVNTKDKNLMTPLHFAARSGHLPALNQLLHCGANAQIEDIEGKSALHCGIAHKGVTKVLLPSYQLPLNTRTFPGHSNDIIDLAVSPKGSLTASISADSTVRVWNGQTGDALHRIDLRGMPASVDLSQDGSMLAVGGCNNVINIWNPNTGAFIRSFEGHSNIVSDVAFSRDGSMIISASWDRTVKLWNTNTGALLRTFSEHTKAIDGISISSDGSMVASGGKDIKVWDIQENKLRHTLLGHANGIQDIAFNRDGSMIASTSFDKTIIWNARTGIALHDFSEAARTVIFSRDGLMLVSGGYEQITFRHAKTGNLLHKISLSPSSDSCIRQIDKGPQEIAFNGDESMLVYAKKNSINFLKMRWDSILHHAVRKGNFSVVKLVANKFPLLVFIRTPQGESPLELAEELMAAQGNGASEFPQIVDFLKRKVNGT